MYADGKSNLTGFAGLTGNGFVRLQMEIVDLFENLNDMKVFDLK